MKRDWNLDIYVDKKNVSDVLSSLLLGTIDLSIEGGRTNVLLCAQPKSASLYLTHFISLCLDLKNHQIGFNKGGGEIYYPRLVAAKFTNCNTISHCHAEADRHVLSLIKTLNLYPILLTRNLLDSLVSRRHMLFHDKIRPKNFLSDEGVKRFKSGSFEYQIDVVIELFASTYINFYAGWQTYKKHNPESFLLHITYEQLIENEVAMILNIAEKLSIDVSPDKIKDVSAQIKDRGGINFSTGVVGRGKQQINERQIEELRRKAKMLGCDDEEFLGFSL